MLPQPSSFHVATQTVISHSLFLAFPSLVANTVQMTKSHHKSLELLEQMEHELPSLADTASPSTISLNSAFLGSFSVFDHPKYVQLYQLILLLQTECYVRVF